MTLLRPAKTMGAETLVKNGEANAPLILGLQPAALVDHVARVDWSLLHQIPGERGGSIPVEIKELEHILSELKRHILASIDEPSPMKTMAGGSVANTIRGLSAGFGVNGGMIGAYGDDEQGQLFVSNMDISGVNISRLRRKNGPTAQCVCLVDAYGNRTMRPCLSTAVKVQGDELSKDDFSGSKVTDEPCSLGFSFIRLSYSFGHYYTMRGAEYGLFYLITSFSAWKLVLLHKIRLDGVYLSLQWLVMRYGIFNLEVIQAAIRIAKQECLFVSLDLASFEMVRNFREPLLRLLESGDIDLCFANEDEATELLRGEENADPEAALGYLSKYCRWAVVTLGANGCIAKHGQEIVRVPAIGEAKAVDATGAGDLFASGFLYGLIKGLSLEDCCKVGSCSGGAVTRSLGGEVTLENWQWMYKQMQIKGLLLPEIQN
ncbi:hypothetical protein V6N13_075482 [Hibiscus sabdariffa]|uniref:Carbohydrate kinase PfkB domain-containing protein n=1 Tax=Hibiscus sabdariffa TaxID=183260 RepID=A0ABR2UBX0_9ROSI